MARAVTAGSQEGVRSWMLLVVVLLTSCEAAEEEDAACNALMAHQQRLRRALLRPARVLTQRPARPTAGVLLGRVALKACCCIVSSRGR